MYAGIAQHPVIETAALTATDAEVAPSASEPQRLWGADIGLLHDRYWASRGLQAVRRGESVIDPDGPDVFLLTTRPALLLFNPKPLVNRLLWLRTRVLRLRIDDVGHAPYEERVALDGDGHVQGIQRHYRLRGRTATRAWLTTDRGVAERWAAFDERPAIWKALQREVGIEGTIPPGATQGLVYDRFDREQRADFARQLLRAWDAPEVVFPGVYIFDHGVVAHETSVIHPLATVIGPVWIGAGVKVSASAVVVGPAVLPDADRAAPPTPVDWRATALPDFPLLPRFRRTPARRVSKRLFDIAFSLAAILLTLPVYPLVMLMIALEDGWPPFFAHRRQTLGGRDFPCLKFRTMRKDAEQIKAALMKQNQVDGPQFKIDNDPRVLKCGHVFRKLQIDELPQFLNVLAGHMSVVGPRPSPDKENQYCPAWREARLSVRPGITGLWQVKRTREPETDFQEWIRYDLEYVQRESWKLDIWIILQTIKNILLRKT